MDLDFCFIRAKCWQLLVAWLHFTGKPSLLAINQDGEFVENYAIRFSISENRTVKLSKKPFVGEATSWLHRAPILVADARYFAARWTNGLRHQLGFEFKAFVDVA